MRAFPHVPYLFNPPMMLREWTKDTENLLQFSTVDIMRRRTFVEGKQGNVYAKSFSFLA